MLRDDELGDLHVKVTGYCDGAETNGAKRIGFVARIEKTKQCRYKGVLESGHFEDRKEENMTDFWATG
jgi:hypothetical protein